MRKRWVIIPIIILVLFTRCSHTVRPQSLIYLDSFDTYTMRAYNYAYNGDKRGKLLGQINYLVADSFLILSAKETFKEINEKYKKDKIGLDSMMNKANILLRDAEEKLKMDKQQYNKLNK